MCEMHAKLGAHVARGALKGAALSHEVEWALTRYSTSEGQAVWKASNPYLVGPVTVQSRALQNATLLRIVAFCIRAGD